MKRHKSLIPLSIALPSLLAVSASGFNNEYTYKYPFPLYDADAASEEGYTEASYQSTTSRDIRRIHQGWNIYNQEWETIYTDVVTGTYVAASYTWNEGCHSDGWSAVWDVDDPESPENDFFSPTKYGFAEVW